MEVVWLHSWNLPDCFPSSTPTPGHMQSIFALGLCVSVSFVDAKLQVIDHVHHFIMMSQSFTPYYCSDSIFFFLFCCFGIVVFNLISWLDSACGLEIKWVPLLF